MRSASAFAGARQQRAAGTLVMTGPGAFSVEIGGRTAREASWIGMVDTIGLLRAAAVVAYRSWKIPLLGALPLASARPRRAGRGRAAVRRRARHHRRVRLHPDRRGAGLSDPPLQPPARRRVAVGAACARCGRRWRPAWSSTCIAYLTFFVSGVDGLEQLAVFTIVGLGDGGADDALPAARRWSIRDLRDPAAFGAAGTPARMDRARCRAAHRDCLRASRCVGAGDRGVRARCVLAERPVETDAGAGRRRSRATRSCASELGAPDVRYVLALEGARRRGRVAGAANACSRALQRLRAATARSPATTSPRATCRAPRTQRARQAKLPDARRRCSAALDAAVAPTPFRTDVFERLPRRCRNRRAAPRR